jgi:hypothetical protein
MNIFPLQPHIPTFSPKFGGSPADLRAPGRAARSKVSDALGSHVEASAPPSRSPPSIIIITVVINHGCIQTTMVMYRTT